MKRDRLDTLIVHAGEPDPRIEGAVVPPIFQSTLFESRPGEAYHQIRYPRLNNTPNHAALHAKLAALEGAEAARVTASGMAAISSALVALLGAGDHLLIQRGVYGGTRSLLDTDLRRLGVSYTAVDAAASETWAAALRPETKAIYVETLSNPTIQIPDLEAVVEFARDRGLVSMIDNTFASPVNFRPAERGFDLSLHSATKYLNGHSDLVAGAAIGSEALIERIGHTLNHLGGSLDAMGCYLLHRGLKTLGLRVRRQSETAGAMAAALAEHPAVAGVNYPGLPDHPGHARAARLLDGFGGMLSFELAGGVAAAERFVERVRLPAFAPSLGGVETLLTFPARTTHVGLSPEVRRSMGIGDGLLRISVGVEDPADLLEDVLAALG